MKRCELSGVCTGGTPGAGGGLRRHTGAVSNGPREALDSPLETIARRGGLLSVVRTLPTTKAAVGSEKTSVGTREYVLSQVFFMDEPKYDWHWAEDLDLPDLESRNKHWPFSVSEISVHLTRKFPLTHHEDTLLVKLHGLSQKEWDDLHPTMQRLIIQRLAEIFRARRQGGDARSDSSQSPSPEPTADAW